MILEAQIARFRARWERLSARERTLLTAMGITFVAMTVVIVGFVITDGLATLEDRNADSRQALRDLETQRDSYLKSKAKAAQLETRMGKTPVQLQGFLEQVGKDAGVEIPESDEQAAQPTGKSQFQERSVTLRLKQVTLESLTKFMRGIETGPNLVVITALNIKTRDDKHQDLEVEMTVTTWDHATEKKDKTTTKKGDKT
jgi:type II secretory pathway component PulM